LRRFTLPVVALLLGAGLSVVTADPAVAATPGGTYVALPVQSRVVDTRTGAAGNHKGAVRGGHSITVTIAGKGGVPSSGVGSVVATISAISPTASGGIVGYVGTRPHTTNLQFTKGHPATDTAVLPLASGRVTLFNTASSGSVQIVVDVSGYYTSGTASGTDPGIFHSVRPARVVNTVTGGSFGNRHGALPAGHSTTANLAHAGVPSSAGAVAVTITALHVARPGSIIAHRPDEPQQNLAIVHFLPGRQTSAFAVLRVSGGRSVLTNRSDGSIDLTVDVLGYYTIGFAKTARAFQTVVPTRLPSVSVPASGSRRVSVAGKGGVPLSGVAATLVTLHVAAPARSGGLQAWRSDRTRPRTTSVLQFEAGHSSSNVVLVPLSRGAFSVHNSSSAAVTLVVDIDGFVPSAALPSPTAGSTARYVRNIVDDATSNTKLMAAEGTEDASDDFVLLDIGAQLNDKTGVALSAVNTRITYGHLVTALNAYLDAYAAHGGNGTVAVGTNNSGDWSMYHAVDRGADWATKVIEHLHVPPGGRVVGAVDFEAGFASTEPQAAAWKTAFLSHIPGTGTALVFNGSADFCPKTWTSGALCNFGWTYQRLYDLAGGSRTKVLPQVYFGYMATEWAEIDRTGGGHLRFLGSLTEHALVSGSLAATQGWTALRRAVSSVTTTSIGPVVADIHA
jgi:hypothetical protein